MDTSPRIFAGLFFFSIFFFYSPSVILAVQPDPGCHVASASEQKEMESRGLPKSFQVCPKDMQLLGIGQDFDQWYAKLKGQSPCNKNKCTLSCRTRNTGAQVCGPTARRWGSIGCHPNNNTAIFPSVAYGFAAHIELLRRYCGERGRCTIASVIKQWTGTTSDIPAYANFVSRNAGIPVNKVFDPNDIDLVGRLALAMSCFEAGSLPYTASELKQGLTMAAGGPRVPTPGNVGELLNESLAGSYDSNPSYSPNSHPGSWDYSPAGNNGQMQPPPMSPSGGMSPQQPKPTFPQTLIDGLKNLVQGQKPKAVLAISAHPMSIHSGEKVTIIWSAAGVKEKSCTLYGYKEKLITRGESGSKSFTVKSERKITVEFTLKCTDLSDSPQPVEEKVVVNVEGSSIQPASSVSAAEGGEASSDSAESGMTFDDLLAARLAQKKQSEGSSSDDSSLNTAGGYQGNADEVRLVSTDEELPKNKNTSSGGVYIKKSGTNTTFDSSSGDIAVVVDLTTEEDLSPTDTEDQTAVFVVINDVLKNIQTALNEIGRILLRR